MNSVQSTRVSLNQFGNSVELHDEVLAHPENMYEGSPCATSYIASFRVFYLRKVLRNARLIVKKF